MKKELELFGYFMENNLVPKFSKGDFVVFDKKTYEIKEIHAINWFMECPFVYGLSIIDTVPREPLAGKLLMVRESLLETAKEQEIATWRILYAKRKS